MYILTLTHFFAEVIHILHRLQNIDFLKFQQSYKLFRCNFDYKHLFIKINQQNIILTI